MLLKINKNPSSKELRQFGLTLIIGFGILGSLLFWREKVLGAYWMWGVSGAIGTLALIVPSAARVFYLAWMGFAVVMGGIMTRFVLSVLFIFLITPVALVFRMMGRDALHLKEGPAGSSDWIDVPKISDSRYYKRLF